MAAEDVRPASTAGDGAGDDAGADGEVVDGRRLRRERNIASVIDAVLEMFVEEVRPPTIERAAERSGLSLRSVYRYFPDAESLTQAAIDELWRRGQPAAHLRRIGEGPFEDRVLDFARMRVRLYDRVGHGYRVGRIEAPRSVAIRDDLARTRRTLTEQFEQQFAPELDGLADDVRAARIVAADVMSQLDAIDLLRRARGMSVDESVAVVAESLRALLAS